MKNRKLLSHSSLPVWKRSPRSKGLALLSSGVAFFSVLLAGMYAPAAEYYVSPTGSDSNPGTQASPFATLTKGNGTAAAGELEWRSASHRFAGFFAGGGGFGWMDSKGYEVRGGQGQDFNLNWLLHSGLRYRTRHDWWCSLGLYFQHISNRGMDKVNPGLNALGPTFGIARKY